MIQKEFTSRQVAMAFAKKYNGTMEVANNAFGRTIYIVTIMA